MATCERCYDPEAGDFEFLKDLVTGEVRRLCAQCAELIKIMGEKEVEPDNCPKCSTELHMSDRDEIYCPNCGWDINAPR